VNIEIKCLTYAYGHDPVLRDIEARFAETVTAVIGPNGAGKSTLLKCLAGIYSTSGSVFIGGEDIHAMKDGERASLISYLPQQPTAGGTLTVFESVLLGRVRSLKWRVGEEDLEKTYRAVGSLGIEHLASRPLCELSGGEKQSAAIARALVCEPKILLLDEFTNNLDIRHKLSFFHLICGLAVERGITTVLALHDINFAARFADSVLVLNGGVVEGFGPPREIITKELLRGVYGIEARVEHGPNGDAPFIVPLTALSEWSRT
jgi:iron complex transport system ATP-binding protein